MGVIAVVARPASKRAARQTHPSRLGGSVAAARYPSGGRRGGSKPQVVKPRPARGRKKTVNPPAPIATARPPGGSGTFRRKPAAHQPGGRAKGRAKK